MSKDAPLRRSYGYAPLSAEEQETIQVKNKNLEIQNAKLSAEFEHLERQNALLLSQVKHMKRSLTKIKDEAMDNIVFHDDPSLYDVVRLLKMTKEMGCDVEYNLEKCIGHNSLLNTILIHCSMKDTIADKKLVLEVLNQAKELKQYYHPEDHYDYGPLFWIQEANKNLALKLLPYFKSRDYKIDNRDILSDEILKEWDKLHASDVEVSAKRRKLSAV